MKKLVATTQVIDPETGETHQIAASQIGTATGKGYILADQKFAIAASNLGDALRKKLVRLVSDKKKVSVEVQRKIDLGKDFDKALWSAGALGCLLGLLGLVPAAWYLFLVMLGQIASALRKG